MLCDRHCISPTEITVISRAVRWCGEGLAMYADVGRGRRWSGGGGEAWGAMVAAPFWVTMVTVWCRGGVARRQGDRSNYGRWRSVGDLGHRSGWRWR
ncbi:hypothetical protein F511_47009 [Dorcoceras hygrometricum]|uniref:Uncharacterized protein n=1 Tax=Dorcoceras hygrometricum TaxID=472368 RepID=A0A2Z6ZS18_9LAMI|nr:hypothetical protein F511_47009 [Dorcoceras hygrometricum]